MLAGGCDLERTNARDTGIHGAGFADPDSAAFHAGYLRDRGDPLSECQSCHGNDYAGGAVGVSCRSSGCHEEAEGPEACTTCHGDKGSPLPTTGAHQAHAGRCADCHLVPGKVADAPHLSGVVDVVFSGLAVAGGATPAFEPASRTCTGVYCHAGQSPRWDDATLGCDGCHGEPPTTHVRFARVAGKDACTTCHPAVTDGSHVDGNVPLNQPSCSTCHGDATSPAPPLGLDGATLASAPSVGAHRRHLDPNLPGRMGKPVRCDRCHQVPGAITQLGHLDANAPADVSLAPNENYDPASQSCVSNCHFGKSPGPVWTDDSGDERACDSCHGFPPVTTRAGTPHPQVQPILSECRGCHPFTVDSHVDGTVEFL
jgi:predicted CxxxxCH...CXXCH cytochrome family protein